MSEPRYWHSVAGTSRRGRYQLWRRHCDRLGVRLLDRWRDAWGGVVLKTDLFEEARGEGLYEALLHRSRRIVGMDVSGEILRDAKQGRPALSPVAADVRRLPFAAGAFDTILSISTLDHFSSHAGLNAGLREIHAALRPGGRLILTLDNVANPKIRLRNALPWPWLRHTGLVPYYVGVSMGPRRLRRTLVELGFEVEEVLAVMHCPRILAVAVSRLRVLSGPTARERFLSVLSSFEALSRLPTRFLTGHYVAVLARRP